MKQASPHLSIVIGALNEAQRIGTTLQALHTFLEAQGMLANTEVVVVTADATDSTHRIVAQELQAFPLHQHLRPGPRVGKGRDIAYGMLRAHGRLRIFMDADLAAPLHHLPAMLEALDQQPDALVIGVRHIRTIHRGVRSVVSHGGNMLFRLGTGLHVTDTQCGLKGMSAQTAQRLFRHLRIHGWGFDMELIAIAHANHHPIVQITIDDWQDVAGGTVHGNMLRASLTSLKELALIAYRNLRGAYRLPGAGTDPDAE